MLAGQKIIPRKITRQSTIVTKNTPVISPTKIGRLAFIKNGDIYHTDLRSTSLLVKNTTPAFDKLSWSPTGRFLAWRSKSSTGIVNKLIIYDRETGSSFSINPFNNETGELLDYAWSPDEDQIAILTGNKNYQIYLFPTNDSAISPLSVLIDRGIAITKIFWPTDSTIIFLGDGGIKSIKVSNSQISSLVESDQVVNMKISPKKDKILYSVLNQGKIDLYLINIDGSANKIIPKLPENIDMGKIDLSIETLENGFIPHAVFMPTGERLLVGYKTNKPLSLVGVYDVEKSNFGAIGLFDLREDDLMINSFHLLGVRGGISLFTLEDNSPLGLIWFIPEAKSPTFYLGINP